MEESVVDDGAAVRNGGLVGSIAVPRVGGRGTGEEDPPPEKPLDGDSTSGMVQPVFRHVLRIIVWSGNGVLPTYKD